MLPRSVVIIGLTLISTAGAIAAEKPPTTAPVETRLRDAFAVIRDFDFWIDNDPWARAILTMIDAGKPGLPVLLEELRDTNSARLQRTIPVALGEIGDRRAIPFLIYALARGRADTGNNGFSIPDGELHWRMRQLLNRPVDDPYGTVSDDRPEQVMSRALVKLTGRDEAFSPSGLYWNYGEDGEWPKDWDESTRERQRQIARRVADRWWTWWETNKQSLLTPDELAWVNEHAPTNFQNPPDDSKRSMNLAARDEADAVVKDCTIEVWADREHYAAKPDDDGKVRVALPAGAERVTVVAARAGSVPLVCFWDKDQSTPADYTIPFSKAVESRGKILGSDGKPLAGALVWLIAPRKMGENRWADVALRDVRTDENGQWTAALLPESVSKLKLFVYHDRHQLHEQSVAAEKLRDGTLTITLKPVFDLAGVVRGPDGKPIGGASVRALGEPAYKHDYPPVRSDADGKFLIPRVVATKLFIAVQAERLAPQLRTLDVTAKGIDAEEFALTPGRSVLGHVVDADHKPLAGALVALGNFGGVRLIDWSTRTDANGRFEWVHAPPDPLNLEVFKSGFISQTRAAVAAGDDAVITLTPRFRVGGTVTDAKTGKPIKDFTYVQGILGNRGKGRFLWRNYQQMVHDENGKYLRIFPASHSPQERAQDMQQWYIRVEADGHKPAESRIFDEGEGALTFNFALEPADPVTGTVVAADGKPLVGAEVLLATPTQVVEVYDGKVHVGGGPERMLHVKSDDQGRFTHRPQNEPYLLIALHDSGYARATGEELAKNGGRLMIQPWGRIEGTVARDRKPVPKAQLTLSEPYSDSLDPQRPRVQPFTCVNADAKGHFLYERVMAGRYRLSAQHEQQGAMGFSGPGFPIEVQSGKTLHLDFGGEAKRTIIGRLKAPDGEKTIDWSSARLIFAPRREDRRPPPKEAGEEGSVEVRVVRDGSFKIEDVHAGSWTLIMQDLALPPLEDDASSRLRTARGGTSFELPAGESDAPLDLGEIDISITRAPLKPGMTAPPIEARTLDGKTLKLSDYAGKYVLLNFWATWCGPCRLETPNLLATYNAFHKDDRLVMIGLSMDSMPGQALSYTRANGLGWAQGFIGMWGENRAPADYGFEGIPAILLIGPDGRVLATELRGPGIKNQVGKFLMER